MYHIKHQSLSMNLNTSQMILRPPTDTEKGIVNMEIEDLRKDIQDLKKGKGHTLPHYYHHQNFNPGRHMDNDNENKGR